MKNISKNQEIHKQKISADDFLVLQFHIVTTQTQEFADTLQKDYSFDKGLLIMIYFYIYTYMLIFSLKKDYPVNFIEWIEEELTEGYIKTIKSEDFQNRVRNTYKYLKERYDNIFKNDSPILKIFAEDIIGLLFNGELDAILNMTIFIQISSHFTFILETTNQYEIIL